ncbi:putative Autophagy-related protein 22 [Desulfovibrio sp. X2]|uniref:MFS transporter n=1 Tax=Desulfovibrio sp. X2 TaxID=941449 RepID=UPI000358826F|nr:MFS transporter [Desulfovibrio sp. X2]EPR43638.1 putative Autophagy-related protein 22 [Desulfovibrio sp. X2]
MSLPGAPDASREAPARPSAHQLGHPSAHPPASASVVRAWCLYDWANSAYILSVATAVLPAWFATGIVGPQGYALLGLRMSATTLWGLTVGLSALAVFLLAPVLGAAADLSGRSGTFLRVFCLAGAAAAVALGFRGPGDVLSVMLLFAAAQAAFNCANVFYDSYLLRVAGPEDADRVSGRGYAYGYVGGGLHFLLALGLMTLHERLGLTQGQAARLAIASAGVWWALFALPAFRALRDVPARATGGPADWLRQGLTEALETARSFTRGGPAATFLLAYLLYNDGIQTTIGMATIYGKEELGLPTSVLMLTLLLIQAVAFAGAIGFARLAGRIGTRRAILLSLLVWTGVAVSAYEISGAIQFAALGGVVGLVLGGSQALSRSYYARLVPGGATARHFGYFSVVTKFSAIGGPLVFAVLRQLTGSSRPAILAVACFFLAGMVLLARVREPGPGR